MIEGSEANSALGRNVEIVEGETVVQGMIKAVTRSSIPGVSPTVLVNGNIYQWNQVSRIFES
jgi:hypothetical protein